MVQFVKNNWNQPPQISAMQSMLVETMQCMVVLRQPTGFISSLCHHMQDCLWITMMLANHIIPKLKNTNNLEHLGTLGYLNRDWKILLAVGDGGGGAWARRPQYKIVFYRSVVQSVRGWWWQVPICFLFTNYHVIGVSLFVCVSNPCQICSNILLHWWIVSNAPINTITTVGLLRPKQIT